MSLAVDETAGDLPVRDVGLRAGLITSLCLYTDRQRLFRIPREQLEDQCLRIQEENTLLKQHSRTQEQKLRRLSAKLLRLKQGPPSAGRDGELEDTIQELEAHVATLESQKRALQSKLSLAKQHILDLGVRTHYRPRTGEERAAQTAPARYGISSQEDTRGEIDRLSTIIENQQGRVAELELSAQSLRETLRDKEKEIEGIVKDLRKQQADGHRLIIKDNVDVIRLQKQLSEKSTSLLVLQEKFAALQEVSHNTKTEQKHFRVCSLLLTSVFQLQERVSDLEGERNLLKNSYDSLLEMQRETQGMMCFLKTDEKIEETSKDLTAVQASHAETVLELQKTRDLLLLQHRLNADLQVHTHLNYKQTIPLQYTWTGLEQESVKPAAEGAIITQLHGGESLLEIHLTGATFTPLGLRLMGQGTGDHQGVATFCTYGFLDFETLSTSLISGGQPNYGFTSHYALSEFDLEKLRVQDGSITIELHQALGGVQFMTRGRARISLMGALQRRGERMKNRTNITGEVIGILEFWVCLQPQVELTEPQMERATSRIAIRRFGCVYTLRWNSQNLKWKEPQEIYDYGIGIPNELEVVLERCVGLSTRWPGLLPDAYLTYRLYDLPPHSTPIIQCCVDPVFEDSASYPLAVTTDLLEYLNVGSLWVYVFDDSERQTPPTYLAKTPIPLRGLAAGRPIRGNHSDQDAIKQKATLRWKYPFQSPEAPSRQREGVEKERMVPSAEVSQRPIAKPRVSNMFLVLDVKSQLYIIKSYICLCVSQGDRLRVEILSLSFNRSSSVALDQSVHQVYVEYRLLGIPMETTETPMSLRKPTDGEEIHYNFTRVIHVDSMEAAPLRHYLYTMLEGSDPNQGRLKFTVVSEPMNEQEECEDVGYAYLDLRELLLTGNDFIEEQIDVVSVDEEQDVVGKLKVSVEASSVSVRHYELCRDDLGGLLESTNPL
uniref:RPGR interacting protein 1 n=1 Tax=Sinocyclocheilus anshuiensis TaxID=1608454 RepID=A0A671KW63_9TELE